MIKISDLVNLINTLRLKNKIEEGWLEFESNHLGSDDFARVI